MPGEQLIRIFADNIVDFEAVSKTFLQPKTKTKPFIILVVLRRSV